MSFLVKKPKRAAVLGCGPTGMFVAHAFAQAGWDVTIYSKKRRSEMFGAQYLHQPIPGLTEAQGEIRYDLIGGSHQDYRQKVYGDQLEPGQVSTELFAGLKHEVWDIRAAYYDAWALYSDRIVNEHITPSWISDSFVGRSGKNKLWERVVSTIPAPALCYHKHDFLSRTIWAQGDAPERGIFALRVAPAGHVVCNAAKAPSWYRASNVFGYNTVEWAGSKPPLDDIAEVQKPVRNNCDCFDDLPGFQRVGRYGQWRKGVLTHHAYQQIRASL